MTTLEVDKDNGNILDILNNDKLKQDKHFRTYTRYLTIFIGNFVSF